MKKNKILEYYEGNPDTIEEFDDETEEFIRAYKYTNPNVISFAYFQTSLDGDKEFIYDKKLSHHDISEKLAKKIIGKAYASEDVDEDFENHIAWAIYDNAAFKGRVFLDINAITTWVPVSSNKLAEIVEKLGGLDEYEDFIYVNPDENGQDNMSVIEYIYSDVESLDEEAEEELMSHNIKDSSMIEPWMIDLIREYNTPNSTLAAKTAKLGNMTIAQYNSLIRQESMEGKKTINEYFEGNPDEVYDTEKKIYHRWDYGSAITFGYFPVSLDDEYEFMSSKNRMHLNLANLAAQKVIGNSNLYFRQKYGEDGEIKFKNKVGNECMRRAYCKGRYWTYPKSEIPYPSLISFWKYPSSEQLKEICDRLNIDVNNTIFVQSKLKPMHNMTVKEYIDGSYESHEEKTDWNFNSKLIKFIKDYHDVDNSWSAEKERNGWKTLAQRNATIYQEEKEPKNTIKENKDNMKNNKHQEEFSNYIKIMNEALQKNDYKAYEYVKEMLDEAVDESKHEKELMNEMNTTNFGVLNHIFESELPTLIKTNKKAVRNVIKTIKEDKNLQSQFSFYNVIKEQYNSNHAEMISPEIALEKLVKIVCEEIDPKTIKKSNKKLRDVMIENNIIPSDFIDEESKKLYENGNVILTTKRTSNNMLPLAESYDTVCKWMTAHKDDKVKNTKDVDTLVREFEEKLKTNLNESEMSFVQEITDFRSPIAEKRKEKLFNKFKNECISKINDMLKEDAENTELKGLSDQINEMTFDKNNIVKDIAKLLEIRDILMDD